MGADNQEFLDNLWSKKKISKDTTYMTFGFGQKGLKLIDHKEQLFSKGPKKYILAFLANNENLAEEHMKNEFLKSDSCFVFTLKKDSNVWTSPSKFVVIDKLHLRKKIKKNGKTVKIEVKKTPNNNMDWAWAKEV